MAQKNEIVNEAPAREFVFTRLIDAPRALTFKAWTDPKHLAQWWGPKGSSNPVCEMDVRRGGNIHIEMLRTDGTSSHIRGTVHEVVPLEKFVFTTTGFEDAAGKPRLEVLNTVTFADEKGKTKLTLTISVRHAAPEIAHVLGGMEGVWNQSLHRLEILAPDLVKPVVYERTFNAPMATVWQAIADKDHMKQWYFDLREFKPEVGFVFEFYGGDPQGKQYLHRCKIVEVVPGKKLSYSWEYPGYDGLSYVTFELFDVQGRTKLRLTHEGLETFLGNEHPEFARSNFEMGWSEIVNTQLKNFLEPATV